MCRLLGVVANKPVDLGFSLMKFREYGKNNPSGWGIGWYEGDKAEVYKEKISAIDSKQFVPKAKGVTSKIIMAHVRYGTTGEPAERNSHPFKYNEKKWLFAHNGGVNREQLLSLLSGGYLKLEGETDSEVYFHWILQCIEEHGTIDGIKMAVKEVKERPHSGLNFLLSDGEHLYAFRYYDGGGNYSLYMLERDPSERGPFEYESDETGAMLHSKALMGEKAVLVCSEKLTKEDWKEIPLGTMVVIGPDLSTKSIRIL